MNFALNRRKALNALLGSVLGSALAAGSLASLGPALAQSRTGGTVNQMQAGKALKGYDAVAYFSDRKAVEGKDAFTHEWGGAKWYFASAEHRDAFAQNPARYAPQYGGFCAWGVAHGKLFDIDPVNGWKVVDGKLYVILNSDVKALWEKDQANLIVKGNEAWPKLDI